jgi:hypothetical protein
MGTMKEVHVQTKYEKQFLIFGLRYFTITSAYRQHVVDLKIKKLFKLNSILREYKREYDRKTSEKKSSYNSKYRYRKSKNKYSARKDWD